MTSEHIPELLLSEELNARMDRHGILVWCLVFGVSRYFSTPNRNGEYKHYIPSIDVIIFSDGEWLATYRLLDNGDVLVSNLVRDSYA